ncbi:MAG TPA: VWA domain-containing protein [Acidimicrobiales bacterium]
MAAADRIVTGFCVALRGAGLIVPTGSVVTFANALSRVGLEDEGRVYWAGRATLVRRPEDVRTFDRVFDSYWRNRVAGVLDAVSEPPPLSLGVDDEDAGGEDEPQGVSPAGEVLAVRYSAVEVLRRRDLARLNQSEWAQARRLISALRVSSELRPSRRRRPARGHGRGHPDLRGTVRRNLRRGGVPIERAWKVEVMRPRRVVFLLDVSGSMEPYARALARFAHAAVGSRRIGQVEVFAFGTRLTRITKQLACRDPDAALGSATGSVEDWSGGTRIGSVLQEFNDRWGVRGMARGSIVVVCSDGWDRGDPELVGSEMARLSRVAHRVVWVNPLKASPGYAPLARGMASALPYIHQFVEGHAVMSLEQLAGVIAGTEPVTRTNKLVISGKESVS